MDIEKIQVIDYKCFQNVELGCLKPINIIIGKNNIGKSSILDILEMIYGSKTIGTKERIFLTKIISDDLVKSVFDPSIYNGSINGNHYEYGKQFIGKTITFQKLNKKNQVVSDFELYNKELPIEHISKWSTISEKVKIEPKITKRILAERNIFPESNDNIMEVDSNGNGVTRIITNFLNRNQYDESLVRDKLLSKLNDIMGEDITFTEIITQQIDTESSTKWEIFLREEGKGRIALSNSGSGLKTILMVLVYTILIPSVEGKNISNYIFLFEELENNLHPSLQRRLLKYLEELTNDGAIFFLTTHSNVTLDAYQNSDLINIFHLQKDNNEVIIHNITNKIQKNSILNDLGVKASDLLQSNGIIWVEGPSDRIYINKWLEMISLGELREGKDYQCVFYGGRLLSHLSLKEEEELINLMNVNRHAIIILDSDKKNINSSLNKTKKRLLYEAKKNGILIWVTKGREIENYIPEKLLKKYYGREKCRAKFGRFQNIEEFIDKLKNGEGNKFLRDKTEFARNILNESNWEDFKDVYDLGKTVEKVENEILSWNYID
ncbi:uncharacterized protein BN778_00473 [Mycoplasma sp. CAG:776]|nr:uncharacterized protein BN778_00473 [Mycoplasma sp. CAG:776]